MSTLPVLDTYAALHEEIRQILRHGKERARQAVEQEKVRTYWEIGQGLRTHFLQHQERAGYGELATAIREKGLLPATAGETETRAETESAYAKVA